MSRLIFQRRFQPAGFRLSSVFANPAAFVRDVDVGTAALLAQHQVLLDSLAYFQEQGEDQIEAIQLYRKDFLDEAELSNNAISASEVFEVNEQDVNAMFLETVAIGIDTFTETQITALWELANQCPLSGGDAVFKARSLYSLIDPSVKYEDEERCASEPEEKPAPVQEAEIAASFQLIPNPAKDELNVKLAAPVESNTWFIVQDMQGRIHLKKDLNSGGTMYNIDTSQFPSGIYYCTIKNQGTIHKSEKLIII
ncbi:MAG: T9SS type A sorting domain-containing protein, partial [Phaeodactylibacter sp.]|nr:T9SS type A sorting domain-containing protein [Phaeodactylibacter sp.]